MADLRIPSGAQALIPAVQPARAEALRAAQRAFFNQALAGVQATAPAGPQTQAPPQPAVAPMATDADPASGEAQSRFPRPGSLLDIKV